MLLVHKLRIGKPHVHIAVLGVSVNFNKKDARILITMKRIIKGLFILNGMSDP